MKVAQQALKQQNATVAHQPKIVHVVWTVWCAQHAAAAPSGVNIPPIRKVEDLDVFSFIAFALRLPFSMMLNKIKLNSKYSKRFQPCSSTQATVMAL